MVSLEIPADIRGFLTGNLTSYEQVAILLLLRGKARPGWAPQLVAEELNLPLAVATAALEQLCRRKLLLENGVGATLRSFRYAPGTEDLARLVDRFAESYAANRLGIMKLLSESAIERVRAQALRRFADAISLGRKKGTDG